MARFYPLSIELPSVTTFIGATRDKSEFLIPWALRKMRERVEAEMLACEMPDEAGQRLLAVLATNPAELYRDETATFGHAVHAWVEAWAAARRAGELEPALPSDERMARRCQGFLDWAESVKFAPLAWEERVWCLKCGYAGRMDLYGTLLYRRARVTALVDLKTGRGVYPEHHLQVAAYRHAAAKRGYPSDLGLLLKLGDTGAKAILARPVPTKVLRSALGLWRWYRVADGETTGAEV